MLKLILMLAVLVSIAAFSKERCRTSADKPFVEIRKLRDYIDPAPTPNITTIKG